MAKVVFSIEVDVPDEDLVQATNDPWRYFWSEVEDRMWESKVYLDD